jgi:2-amino-4-hydroxy-6-hydroxymethyldihydropteridine diphosphokinase
MSIDHTVYLGLGSNLGDSLATLQQALKEIASLPKTQLVRSSPFYQTSPISPLPQNDFINLVCSIITTLSPFELFHQLEAIEKKLGKIPKAKTEPRKIDIDLLLYGDLFIETPELQIPHPRMMERLFVLKPLSDLLDTLLVPQSNSKPKVIFLKDFLKHLDQDAGTTVERLM